MDETAGKVAETTVTGAELGEYAWKTFLPTAFDGHCFYVRQDLTGEQCGEDVMDRQIGGVAIPATAADRSFFVTVLGIGPKVGTKPSKAHRKKYDWTDNFAKVFDIKVGDRLFVAQDPWIRTNRLKRSPINWQDECFIEESLPDGIVVED